MFIHPGKSLDEVRATPEDWREVADEPGDTIMWAVVNDYYQTPEVMCLCRTEDEARAIVAAVDDPNLDVEPFPLVTVPEGVLVLKNRRR